VASQQKLGLWPQWRAWIDRGSPAHPAVDGAHLIANAENVKKTTSVAGNLKFMGVCYEKSKKD
jgi:hypothetical protein